MPFIWFLLGVFVFLLIAALPGATAGLLVGLFFRALLYPVSDEKKLDDIKGLAERFQNLEVKKGDPFIETNEDGYITDERILYRTVEGNGYGTRHFWLEVLPEEI